jgi:HK97 family phage major capsid protein
MDIEIKTALDEMQKVWKEFRAENDKQLTELKAKGHADPLGEEKLQKLTGSLDRIEKEHKARVDDLETKLNRAALGDLGGEKAETKKAREAKAAFFGAMRRGEERLTLDERKVLTVSSDAGGGWLAPLDFVAEIIKAEVLYSPMRALVNVRRTSASAVQIPKRTGTAAATRSGEVATRTESQNPSWGLVTIPAPEMYAETRVTLADLEDSAFNLEQLIIDEFSEQFGVKEGAEIISGAGVNACLGFLDANAAGPSTPISYTFSGQAATIAGAAAGSAGQGDPLVDLFHAVKTAYAARGTWVLNRKSLGAIRKLKDTTGQYLWQPGVGQSGTLGQAMSPTILGAPYVECPDMPDEGAGAFPIAFGDWKRAYQLVDRVEMSVVRDPFTIANVGQVKITARRRVGGQVVLGEAIRLFKCATS